MRRLDKEDDDNDDDCCSFWRSDGGCGPLERRAAADIRAVAVDAAAWAAAVPLAVTVAAVEVAEVVWPPTDDAGSAGASAIF